MIWLTKLKNTRDRFIRVKGSKEEEGEELSKIKHRLLSTLISDVGVVQSPACLDILDCAAWDLFLASVLSSKTDSIMNRKKVRQELIVREERQTENDRISACSHSRSRPSPYFKVYQPLLSWSKTITRQTPERLFLHSKSRMEENQVEKIVLSIMMNECITRYDFKGETQIRYERRRRRRTQCIPGGDLPP